MPPEKIRDILLARNVLLLARMYFRFVLKMFIFTSFKTYFFYIHLFIYILKLRSQNGILFLKFDLSHFALINGKF